MSHFYDDDMTLVRLKAAALIVATDDLIETPETLLAALELLSPIAPGLAPGSLDDVTGWVVVLTAAANELAKILAEGLGRPVAEVLHDALQLPLTGAGPADDATLWHEGRRA